MLAMRPVQMAFGPIAVTLMLVASVESAAQSQREKILSRVAAYVQRFVTDFSNVVAEEDYRQEWQFGTERRRLKSDFLLVQYPGAEREWLSFRDVYEVNGRRVRDQQERLTDLFLQPFEDARRRAEEITRAGSRHSMVELGGTSNPLLVLAFLQAHYQPDYLFTVGELDTGLGPAIRVLELEERLRPTPVTRAAPVPLRGTAWVDEDTGRVVKTELRIGNGAGASMVRTVFGFDQALGIDVPLEMREWRPGQTTVTRPFPRGGARMDDRFIGVATYGRFRRFQVQTQETLGVPDP